MKGPLSAKYSSVIEKRTLRATPRLLLDSLSFAREAYKSEKLVESLSFAIWELSHRLGLFPQDDYLNFARKGPLTLDGESVKTLDSSPRINRFFSEMGLKIVAAPHDWRTLFINRNGEIFGCLHTNDRTLYRSGDDGQTIVPVKEFPKSITSIYISGRNVIFACVKGTVYRSADNGASFEKSLELSSTESYFRRDYGMTETPDKWLVLGEYGNVRNESGWTNLAYMYFSDDEGRTWEKSDFLRRKGANKHVHFVWYSRLLNRLIVADGDNKKRLWVSDELDLFDPANPQWNLVNKLHIQMGGHTAVAESDGKLLFGTDYMGGTNFILESTDCQTFSKKVIPDPYRRSPIMKLAHRKSGNAPEMWALLPYSSSGTRSLLMCTKDGGKSWRRVIEYSGANHGVQMIASSNEILDVLYLSVRDVKTNIRAVYRIGDL